MPNPPPLPQEDGRVITIGDRTVTLIGRRIEDPEVWQGRDQNGVTMMVSNDLVESTYPAVAVPAPAQPAPTPAPARAPAARPTPAQPSAEGEFDAGEEEERPRRGEQLQCPACRGRYTGRLGADHSCPQLATVTCRNCGGLHVEKLFEPPSQNFLCDQCVGRGYFVCKKCAAVGDQRVRPQDQMCTNCSLIPEDSVWERVGYKAIGDDMIMITRSHRPYAVEIECFKMPNEAMAGALIPQSWDKGTDASITVDRGGVDKSEFRSPPMRGDGGLVQMRKDVEAIRKLGYRANKTCGLHVHVDATDMTDDDRNAMHKFGRWVQTDMFKLVAKSRTTSQYCQKLEAETTYDDEDDRYYWMNLSAWHRHRTVEFRLHHGCTNAERVVEWVRLCLRVVERGLKIGRMPQRPSENLGALLELGEYERKYWKAVAKTLNPESEVRI